MNPDELAPTPEKIPDTQPAASGGPPSPPPKPPKLTAKDLLDPGEPGKRIFLADYVVVRELADLLGLKPFRVVAEILDLRQFKSADDLIDYSTAAIIAERHGFVAERLL